MKNKTATECWDILRGELDTAIDSYVIHANSYGFSVSCTDFSYLYGLTGVGAFPYGFFYSRNH